MKRGFTVHWMTWRAPSARPYPQGSIFVHVPFMTRVSVDSGERISMFRATEVGVAKHCPPRHAGY